MSIRHTIIIIGVLSCCLSFFPQCRSEKKQESPLIDCNDIEVKDSSGSEYQQDNSWADSISAITGIGYGPYFYDPSWPIRYSEDGHILEYYPRDSSANHFIIPETVRIIEERAFQCNKNLVEIIVPIGVREIGVCSFYGCENLRKVTIEGPVQSIPWRSFEGCHKLSSIDLPATVTKLDGLSISGCDNLQNVIIRSATPPRFDFEGEDDFEDMWAFADTDLSRCTLYVPGASIEDYRQALGWNRFSKIKSL